MASVGLTIDRVSSFIASSLLVLALIAAVADMVSFGSDPSPYSDVQVVLEGAGLMSQPFFQRTLLIAISIVALLMVLLFCMGTRAKPWAVWTRRGISVFVIGWMIIGYALWAKTGFDH
jgi:hypothetical protein